MKKTLSVFLSLVMMVSCMFGFGITGQAETVFSGNLGYNATIGGVSDEDYEYTDDITFTIDDAGVLTITGSGVIPDFDEDMEPWTIEGIRDSINKVVVGEGITVIGAGTFEFIENMQEIILPSTIERINTYAFYNCASLAKIYIPGGIQFIYANTFGGCADDFEIYYGGSEQDAANITIEDEIASSCTWNYNIPSEHKLSPHNFGEEVVEQEAVCKEGTITKTCSLCGYKDVTIIPAVAHIEDEGTVTKEPNCGFTGVKTFKCTRCGDVIREETLSIVGSHQFQEFEGQNATCTEPGYSSYRACKVCGREFDKTSTPALGHSYSTVAGVEATCGNDGHNEYQVCTRCDEIEGYVVIPATGNHQNIVDVDAVDPTCIKNGFTAGKQCLDCNRYTEGHDAIECVAHNTVHVDEIPATCSKAGKKAGEKCTVCGQYVSGGEVIPVVDHTPVKYDGVALTDCTKGYIKSGVKCSVCGAVISGCEVVNPKDHTIVTDKAVAPTFSSTGKTEGSHCSTCGKVIVKQEVVPKYNILGAMTTVNFKSSTTTAVTINWAAVSGASGYYVYSVDKNNGALKLVTTTSAKSATISNLKPAHTYYFAVKPYGYNYKNELVVGKYVKVKTVTKPAKVTLKSVKALSGHKLQANWSKVTCTGYEIVWSTNKKFTNVYDWSSFTGQSKTSYKNGGFKKGKKYYVRMRAFKIVDDEIYYGAWSNVKTVKAK